MPPGVPARSGAEQGERVLPALLHTHGKAWEKSLWLRGSTARLQEPAGSRGDPASGNRGGKVLCEVQDPGARGSVHVVRTDTQGWPRGSLLAARAGAPGGNECPCLRRAAPPSCWAAGADTCARVHLEGDPREDGAGHLSSPTPPGLGARHLAPRGAQGVFPGILDRGSGCGSTAYSFTCGAAADAGSPPSQPGPAEGAKPPPRAPARRETARQKLSVPSSLPSWTPEGYEGEGGKKGREGGKRGG